MTKLIKRDVAEILADLPDMCMLADMTDGKTIAVRKGETGYWPMPHIEDPDAWNARHGVTEAQADAMRAGSMFGFDCPCADPLNQ